MNEVTTQLMGRIRKTCVAAQVINEALERDASAETLAQTVAQTCTLLEAERQALEAEGASESAHPEALRAYHSTLQMLQSSIEVHQLRAAGDDDGVEQRQASIAEDLRVIQVAMARLSQGDHQ